MEQNSDLHRLDAHGSPSASRRRKASSTDSSQVKRTARGRKRAKDVIDFIERLTVPSGRGQGKPFVLMKWQKDFIRDVYEPHNADGHRVVRRAILSLGRKNGKDLALDTRIPTPRGWRTMGNLRVGDVVFDEQGQPTAIICVSPVFLNHRCWRLTFSDGTSIVAGEGHQWLTKHSFRPWANVRVSRSGNGGRWRTEVVTTEQIAQSIQRKRRDGGVEYNHKLPVAGPVKCPDADLPVPPYVLGYWLGNGGSDDAAVYVGEQDAACIAAELERELEFIVSGELQQNAIGRHPRLGLTNKDHRNVVKGALRALGVLGNKHIPEVYKWASHEQRLALLQGLMDSDGTASGGNRNAPRCCFDVMNERLAQDALCLVRSLGFKASIREDVAKINGRAIGPCWSVSFTSYQEDNVFRLQRRASGLVSRRNARSRTNSIVACEEVPSVPTVCIQVDSPSHLFLAGEGFTPTHNSTLIAAIALAHLVGPEAIPHGEIYSAANDRDQASIIFKLARQIVEAEPELSSKIDVVPSTKTMVGRRTASVYRAISAEAGTKHGYLPSVVIYDELAQAKSRDLYDVLDTSFGAREEPLFVTISTQSNDPEHILSQLIDDGLSGVDPTIVCHLHAADENCTLDDRAQWKKANPALGKFRNAADLASAVKKALRMPAEEPKVRNLFLNQRVSPVSTLISRAEWMACEGECPFADREDVYLGLDLSSTTDLTALVMVSDTDPARIRPWFWKPAAHLAEHSHRDFGSGNQRYVEWAAQGKLLTSPGRSIDHAVVARHIAQLTQQYRVRGMAYDRWRVEDLLREFDRVGLLAYKDGERGSGLRLVPWGQGFVDMAPAIDALEKAIMERKLVHASHPVLNWNMANAVALADPAGNRKIDKRKAKFRIDGAVALAMTMGLRARDRKQVVDISALIA